MFHRNARINAVTLPLANSPPDRLVLRGAAAETVRWARCPLPVPLHPKGWTPRMRVSVTAAQCCCDPFPKVPAAVFAELRVCNRDCHSVRLLAPSGRDALQGLRRRV